MKQETDIQTMAKLAKALGLKRLKIGSLEIELSDYTLAIEAQKLLTTPNTVPSTPSLSIEANKEPLTDEEDEEALLFHSSF